MKEKQLVLFNSQRKKNKTDCSNEFYLETRNIMQGKAIKREQVPVLVDNPADIPSFQKREKRIKKELRQYAMQYGMLICDITHPVKVK